MPLNAGFWYNSYEMDNSFESPVGSLWRSFYVALAIGAFSLAPASVRAEDYTKFGSAPAVFTWAGVGSSFTNGAFARFDVTAGADLPEKFSASSGYRSLPGWEGSFVPQFWWLFAAAFDGSVVPYVAGSGYVLRFANPAEPGSQIIPPPALTIGGLIVESGAENITFGSTGSKVAKLSVGVDSETSVNYIDIRENFTLSGTIDRILGKVELSVAEGKIFHATSIAVPAATDNPSVPPTLKFVGEGNLSAKVTAANCAVLDFSAQAIGRTSPFLMGTLTLGTMSRLVLPVDVQEGVAYKLCSGTLGATAGLYAIAKGDGDFFLANATFASGSISYTTAAVNQANLSSDASWSKLNWGTTGYVAGQPVQLTLTQDVTLTVDTASLTLPALLVSGGHRLTLVNRKGAVLSKVFLGRGSRFELVIDGASSGFGKALSVPAGLSYATVLQGSTNLSAPTNWNAGSISVSGRLVTRGVLSIASGLMATLQPGSVLTVESGCLNVKGAGTWTGATLDLGGELAFGSGQWKTTSGSKILLRDGGAIVANGYASATLPVTGPLFLQTCEGADATLAVGLTTSTNSVAMRLGAESTLTVKEATARSIVDVARIVGDGTLSLQCTNSVTGAAYRLRDVSAFAGGLDVGATRASVLLGDAALTAESALVVPEGFTLDSNRDWSAPVARLGSVLNVNGNVSDPLFKVTGNDVDFSSVAVHLRTPDGQQLVCGLGFDSATRQLYCIRVPAPPHFDISDVSFDFGTDFTNGTVRVTVENYWSGYEFEGVVNAEFYVYDASGRLVGYGASNLTRDGVCEVGTATLPNGRGGDYRCEVTVKSINTKTGEEELLYDSATAEPGVHWHGDWFHEDAASFPSVPGSTEDGEWRYVAGDVQVKEDRIEVNTSEAEDRRVVYQPNDDYTNDLVRIQALLRLDGAWDVDSVPPAGSASRRMAGLTLVSEDDRSYAYAIWLPEERRFDRVYGNAPPDVTEEVLVDVMFNYRTGYVCYSVNGTALTNVFGISCFPIPEAHRALGRSLSFQGCGAVGSLDGDRYNCTLAAVCKDGVTNEYESLDAAVAAAKAAGLTQATLLWDASWKPTENLKLGDTFTFDCNGHKLVLDGGSVETMRRNGYRVVDNGGGSYTIDVITYELNYVANGADSGEMAAQHFCATNMVLDLLPNQFVRKDNDFAFWNMAADGSGPTNWADGARVDLTPYGYTNMTLYAQWRVAVRTITIEPADEFVYVESVMTNGAYSLGARYFRDNPAKGTGRVEVPVESGSDVVIRFSTDIEKQLTHTAHVYSNLNQSVTLPYIDLPKLVSPYSPLPADQLAWATKHGIPLEDVAKSPYAQASCDLDLDHLLTDDSTISFTSFTALSDGCAFTLLVDGKPLPATAKIASMVRVLRNYAEGWKTPDPSAVTVGADGRVEVKTGDSTSLFKIVIP